ncbi:hypothetical protein NHQ30_000911 [Ciborinia camelliae]|nr:hypothetical protein NHQ30_000911 [Ciborinia camelliae]
MASHRYNTRSHAPGNAATIDTSQTTQSTAVIREDTNNGAEAIVDPLQQGIDDLRTGIETAATISLGNQANTVPGDLSGVNRASEDHPISIIAIFDQLQQEVDRLRSEITRARNILVGDLAEGDEEEGRDEEEHLEDYTSEGSAGSDIPAIAKPKQRLAIPPYSSPSTLQPPRADPASSAPITSSRPFAAGRQHQIKKPPTNIAASNDPSSSRQAVARTKRNKTSGTKRPQKTEASKNKRRRLS